MNLPGSPGHYWPTDLDDDGRAAWLLDIVDIDARRHTAPILMPFADSDAALEDLEDEFRRAFEIARAGGRRLAVNLVAGQDVGPSRERRIIALVHEHVFVGGLCIHGCGQTE